jgi:hypothetical protein
MTLAPKLPINLVLIGSAGPAVTFGTPFQADVAY